jgi:hypothetical protein
MQFMRTGLAVFNGNLNTATPHMPPSPALLISVVRQIYDTVAALAQIR